MSSTSKPSTVRVRDRDLEICTHGECMRNRIWDFLTCWDHLTSLERESLHQRLADALRTGVDLRRIVLSRAEIIGFDFTGADLSEAFFNGAKLRHCKFVDTNLRRAFFGGADLAYADLTRSELHGTVFSGAKLQGVKLVAYSVSFGRKPINLSMKSFGSSGIRRRPRIDEANPNAAEATYRALKRHFIEEGYYDSASWAAYSERLMQRRNLWAQHDYLRWLGSFLFAAVCGYGEKPLRVAAASIAIIIDYAIVYWLLGVVANNGSVGSFLDCAFFSAAMFSGFTFPDLLLYRGLLGKALSATEAFFGIFALGLFVFTLTKRYVAR